MKFCGIKSIPRGIKSIPQSKNFHIPPNQQRQPRKRRPGPTGKIVIFLQKFGPPKSRPASKKEGRTSFSGLIFSEPTVNFQRKSEKSKIRQPEGPRLHQKLVEREPYINLKQNIRTPPGRFSRIENFLKIDQRWTNKQLLK